MVVKCDLMAFPLFDTPAKIRPEPMIDHINHPQSLPPPSPYPRPQHPHPPRCCPPHPRHTSLLVVNIRDTDSDLSKAAGHIAGLGTLSELLFITVHVNCDFVEMLLRCHLLIGGSRSRDSTLRFMSLSSHGSVLWG